MDQDTTRSYKTSDKSHLRKLKHIIKTRHQETSLRYHCPIHIVNIQDIIELSLRFNNQQRLKHYIIKTLKMQFKSITLVFTFVMATSLMASPLKVQNSTELLTPNEYVELHREKASNGGHLVYYGHGRHTKTARSEAAKLEERDTATCGYTNSPTCSDSHTARNDICFQLVTELQTDSAIAVGNSPRQICYEGSAAESNEYCCVSWHDVIPNLIKGDLASYANTSK